MTAILAAATAAGTSSTVTIAADATVRVGLIVPDGIATFSGEIVLEEILAGGLPASRIGVLNKDTPAREVTASGGEMELRGVKGFTSQAVGLYVIGGTVA